MYFLRLDVVIRGTGTFLEPLSLLLLFPGLDKIEHLQEHSSEQIYHVAHRIIDKYFSDSDEVDSSLDPQQTLDGGQFMFNSNSRPPEGGFNF